MSRKDRNSGAAMVIVLCVMVVFLALSTTVLLAGSVTLNTARNNVLYERGKVQATSLSELFVKDLRKGDVTKSNSVAKYVHDEILGGWLPCDEETYDQEADKADSSIVRTFNMDEADSEHQIRIQMYWNTEEAVTAPVTEEQLAGSGKNKLHLYVDVISTLNSSEYHVNREFTMSLGEEENSDGSKSYTWGSWNAEGRSDDRK